MTAPALAAPGAAPAASALPKEVALVCVLSESLLVRQRWADLFGRAGIVGRIAERIAAQASGNSVGGSNVRLSLVLADLAQTDPARSPVSHTQYFLPPAQFFPPLELRPPAGTPFGRFCDGAEHAEEALVSAGWGDEAEAPRAQGLLEAIVAALELFTHHQTRPFPSTSFADLPLPTFTPIPNTTPLNLPPLPPSAAASPYPGRGPAAPAPARGAIDRHLLLITDGGLRTSIDDDADVYGGVRWNAERKFDGLGWPTVGQALAELDVRTSVLLLGALGGGHVPVVDGKLQALVTPTGKPAGAPWFQTLETDRFLFPSSLAPPPSIKRSLPSPAKRDDGAVKKQRLSPAPGANGTPSLSIPAGSSSGSTTPGVPPPSQSLTIPAGQAQVKREAPLAPAHQVQATGPRGPPPPLQALAGTARPPMRSTPSLHPPPQSTTANGVKPQQAPPPSPVRSAMQRSPLQPARPMAPGGGAAPGTNGPAAQGQAPIIKAEQKQASSELLARMQARQGQMAGAGGQAAAQASSLQQPPQPQQVKLPQQQQQQKQLGQQQHPQKQGMPPQQPSQNFVPQQQQQQQRPMPVPGQQQQQGLPQQQTKPFVWQGEVSWTVHSAAPKGGGNVLGCQVIGYAAHQVSLDEFQAHTWPNRLHLSAVSPLQLNEIKRYVTSGRMPCITLTTFHQAGTSQEDRQRGEQSYQSLARNLDSKKTMGHIRFGPPGCGMVIFAMSGSPTTAPKLMAMCFLKQPIPFATSSAAAPPPQGQQVPQQGVPKTLSQQQQQQQQQQYLAQAPALTGSPQIAQQPHPGQMPPQQQHAMQQQQQQIKAQPTSAQIAALQQLRSNAALQQQQATRQQPQGYPQQVQQGYVQQPQPQQQQQQQAGTLGLNMTAEQIAAILAAHHQSQQGQQGQQQGGGWS